MANGFQAAFTKHQWQKQPENGKNQTGSLFQAACFLLAERRNRVSASIACFPKHALRQPENGIGAFRLPDDLGFGIARPTSQKIASAKRCRYLLTPPAKRFQAAFMTLKAA